jgi:hypothetical protein
MRGTAYAVFLLFCVWIVMVIRMSCTDVNMVVCENLCDRRGRELASMEPGLFTKCNCGERKKAPGSFRRR